MGKRGRPPVVKPWLVTISGKTARKIVILARTRQEAEEKARFMVKQSFPFSTFSVRRYYGRVSA
ncbi:hypothetical protein APY94_04100 [Thermococcus celericrescens]|uniref:50S ribosomal protein L16 n=1 Tax=Thermococcus celericrescens TaxID=227598 RepID=A0A100XYI3_9EURY|nr:hypothetical protein [Thermococcus celericrescens]KUH33920.1 hypothetical protein APY94_04100 [Thermococcus celericrescens]